MKKWVVYLRCTAPRSEKDFEYTIEAETSEEAGKKAKQQAYDRCYNRAKHIVSKIAYVGEVSR